MAADTKQPQRLKCAYCGKRKTSTSYHSGILECMDCWTWRKLDGPAARHWAKVGAEFLSNVDMYDMTNFFEKMGLSKDEWTTMLKAAKKLTDNAQKAIDDRKGTINA